MEKAEDEKRIVIMNTSLIVQKLWNGCTVLRDDGMSYGDYVEPSIEYSQNAGSNL